jgi:hypothetical protein
MSEKGEIFGYPDSPTIALVAKYYLDEIVPVAASKIMRINNGRMINGCESLKNAPTV